MNTDKGFLFLQEQGSAAIALKTHIVRANVDKLLNRSFDKLSKVQLNGFVSILEREYQIDLSDYRAEYLAFHHQQGEPKAVEDVFVETANDQRKNRKVYLGFIIALVVAVVVIAVIYFSANAPKRLEINNTAIDKAKETMKYVAVSSVPGSEAYEVDTVQDQKLQQQQSSASVSPEATVQHDDVIIIPRVKIWLGIINMETHKRRVEMTAEPVRLDGSKEWLIVTGHGRMSVEQGDQEFRYSKRDQMLFMVENGLFQPIDKAEFRARNRGKIW